MTLDGSAGTGAAAFHHVGVNGTLYQKVHLSQLLRFLIKHVDELCSDNFALLLRFGDTFQFAKETFRRFGDTFQFAKEAFRRVNPDKVHIKSIFENFFHLIPFIFT